MLNWLLLLLFSVNLTLLPAQRGLLEQALSDHGHDARSVAGSYRRHPAETPPKGSGASVAASYRHGSVAGSVYSPAGSPIITVFRAESVQRIYRALEPLIFDDYQTIHTLQTTVSSLFTNYSKTHEEQVFFYKTASNLATNILKKIQDEKIRKKADSLNKMLETIGKRIIAHADGLAAKRRADALSMMRTEFFNSRKNTRKNKRT